jgi:hypothetical protein
MTIALGYLYSFQAIKVVTQANARQTLASACLLGGMDDLCTYAFNVCRESIRGDTIEDWLSWVDSHQSPFAPHSPDTSAPSTPRSISPQPNQDISTSSIYGPYAQLLRDAVLDFLVLSLPSILVAENEATGGDWQEPLLRIFSRVSFDS